MLGSALLCPAVFLSADCNPSGMQTSVFGGLHSFYMEYPFSPTCMYLETWRLGVDPIPRALLRSVDLLDPYLETKRNRSSQPVGLTDRLHLPTHILCTARVLSFLLREGHISCCVYANGDTVRQLSSEFISGSHTPKVPPTSDDSGPRGD